MKKSTRLVFGSALYLASRRNTNGTVSGTRAEGLPEVGRRTPRTRRDLPDV